jgi:sulfur carrier protein ThiS
MKISFLGPVEKPPADLVADVETAFAGGTVKDLLAALKYPERQAWFFSVVRNEERLGPDDRVEAGDSVTIMLVVGGG